MAEQKAHTEHVPEGKDGNRQSRNAQAALAYIAFVIPLLSSEKNNPLVRYHIQQAIVMLIVVLAAQGVISILGYWGVGGPIILLFVWALRALLVYFIITGFLNAYHGEQKPLSWIGSYAEKL